MSDINPPKGTVHIKRFGKHELVTSTTRSKKRGHLVFIGARLLDAETVIAFYGVPHG
jgi:hypothetical protein